MKAGIIHSVRNLLLLAGAFAVCVCTATAQIIYQDNFSGFGGALNGAALDIGAATWTTGSDWYDDGTAATTVASGPSGQAAWLPFTPVNGSIYTATATILNDQPNWIGFGFLPAAPVGGDWTVTDFSVRHSNAPGYGWMLHRNSTGTDQEGFLGGGTAGGQPWNGDVADPTVPVTIAIVLDTTSANWSVEWLINGASQSTASFGVIGNPGIGGIGFSHDRNSSANGGATISSFELSQVPEPTTIALAGLGLAGLLIFTRRKN